MAEIVRTRIAPTPSGFLHIGNAYNFLLTEAIARKAGSSLRLRIDDLDALRVRPEYVSDIFESLAWLGIHPDEGPKNIPEQEQTFSQHLRIERYETMLEHLVATGLVFACECSRKDLQLHNDKGQYAGTCLDKRISLNTPNVAWRIQTPCESSISNFHDRITGPVQLALWDFQRHFIIRRRDSLPAYQLASLCDDVDYRINTIVRGADLLTSTAAQLYLATLLGLESFLASGFYHHPLLKDEHGAKLSKSAGSSSLRALRRAGGSADEIRAEAARWYQSFL
jgi:glutamyl/glutaminyl-tRNA synthetase